MRADPTDAIDGSYSNRLNWLPFRPALTLNAKAAEYEEIAAGLRQHLAPKNLVAPGTAARYEYFAKGFREDAQTHRALEEHCDELVASFRAATN